MLTAWVYALASVVIVSVCSLIGVITIPFKRLRPLLLLLVSFSAGAFFGDVFLHLLPEATEETGFTLTISFAIIAGILFSFVIEKFIHWRHCHTPTSHHHPHPFAIMNLVGDCVHNFIDGLVIGASYLLSIPTGIATTIAVVFHEIPQEIGDFGVLLHGGFTRSRAIMLNFLTALTAIIGAVLALVLGRVEGMLGILVPFAAGNFLYIAAADLIPEIHKETRVRNSLIQAGIFLLGIATMALLLLLE
jgi:zinc and cadmium transporter